MAYSLYIERDNNTISLKEWISTTCTVESLRPRTSDYITINPKTGEEIRLTYSEGDLELYIHPDLRKCAADVESEWAPTFFFSSGRASFTPPEDMDDPGDPVRAAAALIAKKLGAKIYGDEGEVYEW